MNKESEIFSIKSFHPTEIFYIIRETIKLHHLNWTNLSIYTIRLLFKVILIHHRLYTCWTKSIVTGRKLLLKYSSQWQWVFSMNSNTSFLLVLHPSKTKKTSYQECHGCKLPQVSSNRTTDVNNGQTQPACECSMDFFLQFNFFHCYGSKWYAHAMWWVLIDQSLQSQTFNVTK